nr:E4 [human papillomavirus 68]WAB54228.1 E4 [human papillomavirus 68]
MANCEVPLTEKYPLLNLLPTYRTPPRPIPPQVPHAPKKQTRRRLGSIPDSAESLSPLSPTTCPWTVSTSHSSVEVQAKTKDGAFVVVTLHL